jgi:Mg2+ and Co2+ transporter CorA
LISLTLLKSTGYGAPAQTVSVFPDKVHEGEMLWVDAESPTAQELADLKSRFDLDEYAIEDVVHRNQRPKLEEYGKNVFAVIHVPDVRSHKSGIIELFVFFQKNWIITIHSDDSELIHSIDSRIRARGLAPLTIVLHLTCSSMSFLTSQLTPIIRYWMRWRNDLRTLTNRQLQPSGHESREWRT